jgi:Zn-dependent protease
MVPVILVSLSFHEFAHAYVSYRLGDPTAKNMGRLTLNPLKHLDFVGTLMMFVAHIGWAKPVPINPAYYKDRKKGTMLVSLAGPLSNILLAFLSAFPLVYLSLRYTLYQYSFAGLGSTLLEFSMLFFVVNLNLAVFNIIPVPPLDGSKILSGILPQRLYFKLMEYENFIGIIFLIIVFVFPGVLTSILGFIVKPLQNAILGIVQPIIGLFI